MTEIEAEANKAISLIEQATQTNIVETSEIKQAECSKCLISMEFDDKHVAKSNTVVFGTQKAAQTTKNHLFFFFSPFLLVEMRANVVEEKHKITNNNRNYELNED